MKVAIDTSPLSTGHAFRGIGTYTRLLFDALMKYDQQNDYIATSKPYDVGADVVHFPYYDLFFLTLPYRKPLPTVVTIHDVIPLVYRDAYPPGIRGLVKQYIQAMSLRNVNAIVTDSDCSTKDVVTYLKQPNSKVTTVYLAPDPQLSHRDESAVAEVRQRYRLPNPYYLYVGDINYNKNLAALLTAFKNIPKAYDLVLVSRALKVKSDASTHLLQLIKLLELSNRVHILSDVPMSPSFDLAAIYSGAFWYIQPSLYEGFGLPVLEAQVCGTPVISSTGGSLGEIVRDSGITFDPTHDGAIADALNRTLSLSASQRSKTIEMGDKNHLRFSWQKTAEKMARIYEKAAHS